MQLKLNLIAAACGDNLGIGMNGRLPWKLKSEMAYFTEMTTKTKESNKKNVVIMGRVTWECIPKKFRPLQNRVNVVLSRQKLDLRNEAIACESLSQVLDTIAQPNLIEIVENIWVIGGNAVYKSAMEHPNCSRIYLTYIQKNFECDTFFPPIPNNFIEIDDPNVPKGVQEENGVQFNYKVYERI
ncbi:dihydrofolate reductase isoform X2 [Microplitis mediator]|nr:dihydrofolate reductase isoform X2 [Microplitis mediator]